MNPGPDLTAGPGTQGLTKSMAVPFAFRWPIRWLKATRQRNRLPSKREPEPHLVAAFLEPKGIRIGEGRRGRRTGAQNAACELA